MSHFPDSNVSLQGYFMIHFFVIYKATYEIAIKCNNCKHWISQALKRETIINLKWNVIKAVSIGIEYKITEAISTISLNLMKKYHSDLLDQNKNSMKSGQIIKNIVNKNIMNKCQYEFKLDNGSITSDKSIIGVKNNEFVIEVCPRLDKIIPIQPLSFLQYLGNQIVHLFFLTEVTLNEINKIIQSLKNGAGSHHEITVANIKLRTIAVYLKLSNVLSYKAGGHL